MLNRLVFSWSGLLMLWIFVLCLEVFRSCCYINSCRCSLWFGPCWRLRTNKSKETCGCRTTLIARAVMTVKIEENHETSNLTSIQRRKSRRGTEQNKAKKAKTSINWKVSTRNFQLSVLVSSFYISLLIEAFFESATQFLDRVLVL